MPRRHPQPIGVEPVPTYRDLDPVLTVGGIAEYLGVNKKLVAKWAGHGPKRAKDWPSPFAKPSSGAIYKTADVIAWAELHERAPGAGPREPGDTRPPSVRRQAA